MRLVRVLVRNVRSTDRGLEQKVRVDSKTRWFEASAGAVLRFARACSPLSLAICRRRGHPSPPQATQGRCGATRATFPRRSHSRSRQRPSLLVHADSGHGGSVAASLRVRGARAPTPSLGSAACRSGELGASITISDVSSVNGSFLSTIGNADGPAPGADWRVTFVDRHGHDHSSPRGRRSAWTVRVAGFRLPKAVMIDSRLGSDVQMVSAASTVGVRSSADIAAPARRPPGAGGHAGV